MKNYNKKKLPYISKYLKDLIKSRDCLYKLYKRNLDNIVIKNQFIKLRNLVTNKIKTEKKNYEHKRIQSAGTDIKKSLERYQFIHL